MHATSLVHIDSELIAQAINKLKTAEIIGRPHLTSQKIALILTKSLEKTSLDSLVIGYSGYGISWNIIGQVKLKYSLILM